MENNFFSFEINKKENNFRKGIIKTPHGNIKTPSFVPVGTNACIKSCISSNIEKDIDIDLIFCNTYHLLVHPGANIVEKAGGLHNFMNRTKPIITDSGGFQVFSLMYGGVAQELKSKGLKKIENTVLKLNENGVKFRSYRNGEIIELTPETSIQAQKKLGADIIIPFDELLPFHSEEKYFKKSFHRTHRWQVRSLYEHKKNIKNQAIYAVIHGGVDPYYRKKSCDILKKHDFDGFAIGGSLGTCLKDVIEVLKNTICHLPPEKPRHLLGIADIETVKEAVKLGIDTFDSSYPTKCARHGLFFSDHGNIKIGQSKWKNFHEPISNAPICKEYKASYLHHLYKMKENTYATLASIHNIWYLNELTKKF